MTFIDFVPYLMAFTMVFLLFVLWGKAERRAMHFQNLYDRKCKELETYAKFQVDYSARDQQARQHEALAQEFKEKGIRLEYEAQIEDLKFEHQQQALKLQKELNLAKLEKDFAKRRVMKQITLKSGDKLVIWITGSINSYEAEVVQETPLRLKVEGYPGLLKDGDFVINQFDSEGLQKELKGR